MKTIDKIKFDGLAIIDKIKRGEAATKEESEILKIYNSLYSKKCPTAGKRIVRVQKQRITMMGNGALG